MSVSKEPSGRRSIAVEIEVPGTPERVWQAIATGPGISSWFVPSQLEEGEGGSLMSDFGPGMKAISKVTSWEPPYRFTTEGADLGPEAPPVATEWIVEGRSGGTCVVRIVQSLFASSDDWDDQLTGQEGGWAAWFRILKLYLTYFPGQPGVSFRLVAMVSVPASEAWNTLVGPLGLTGAEVGERWSADGGATPFSGIVEWTGDGQSMMELRLEEPALGLAFLFAHDMGEKVYVAVNVFLYGDQAAEVAARVEPLWQAWMKERFGALQEAPC
jgi:uncharacterized protein YndB with AHSA1/START domain